MQRLPVLLWICAALAAATLSLSCTKKAPLPPTEFDSPQRAMTGDPSLENRVSDGIVLELMTEEELVALKEEGGKVGQSAALSRYVAARTGRGEVQESINTLMDRAWINLGDEVAVADLLDLTMGQLKWSACAQIATELAQRRRDSAIFLIRALCLRRSGDAVAAAENVAAAEAQTNISPDALATLRELLDERASGNQLPPADEDRYRVLRDEFGRSGPLYRLFVQHLTERSEPGWTTGSLDWFGLRPDEERGVVLSRSRSYRHCHALAQHASKAPLGGSATIVWFIDGLGRVTNAQISESDWGGHEQGDWLNACLVDQINKLRFPVPKYGRYMPARHKVAYSAN